MRPMRCAFVPVTLLLASGVPTQAQDAGRANETLLAATSPYEDMVEFALAEDDAGVAAALASADGQAAGVQSVLPQEASSRFTGLVRVLHEAAAGRKHEVLAMTGVDVFRLLLDHLDPAALVVPKEVGLLDYAGFRLHVLAAAARPDWSAMRATVEEASRWWNATSPRVTRRALRDAFDSTVEGLQEAAETENLPMLIFAAQMDLDLVDLLEGFFEGQR